MLLVALWVDGLFALTADGPRQEIAGPPLRGLLLMKQIGSDSATSNR